MADPWCFFVALETWRTSSPRRCPPCRVCVFPWQGGRPGVRHRFVLARVDNHQEG